MPINHSERNAIDRRANDRKAKIAPILSIRRMVFVLFVLQAGFLLLLGKLYQVQVVNGTAGQDAGDYERLSRGAPNVKRGKILDRHGTILGLSRHRLHVTADPRYMRADPREVARQLAPILGATEAELLAQLTRKNKRFVSLKRDVDYEALDEIRALQKKIRGLKYTVEQGRTYPKGSLAAQVIGNVNAENRGEGIEYQYNAYLTKAASRESLINVNGLGTRAHADDKKSRNRQRRFRVTQRDVIAPTHISERLAKYRRADYGHSVVLTIDEYIQYVAEKELAAACKQWNAPRGTVIVLASKTAEILALASYPTYELNAYGTASEEAKRNMGVWFAYEPGSVFKIVASSAVLNQGIMTRETPIFCEHGRFRVGRGRVVRDVSPKGWLTLEEVLHKSSNIGMIKIVKTLGHQHFSDYIGKYGFGRATGIDLPHEHSGSLYAVRNWDTNSLGAVPFGQGILVTPLQMVSALNVIATGGELMRPYITREIRDSTGKVVKKVYPIPVRRVLKPAVAKLMAEILVGVVEGGSGRRAQVEGYRVAGKTGTAQKAEIGKGYVNGKEIMSFMGFLPAENPQVSIIVMLDEPTGARFSGQIAAPLFKAVATQTMQYFKQTEFFSSVNRMRTDR